MSVRSSRIATHQGTASSGHTVLATVPVGETWLVKSISAQAYNPTGGDFAVMLRLTGTTNDIQVVYIRTTTTLKEVEAQFVGFHVLEPGDSIALYTQNGGSFDVWVSGAKLQGVA